MWLIECLQRKIYWYANENLGYLVEFAWWFIKPCLSCIMKMKWHVFGHFSLVLEYNNKEKGTPIFPHLEMLF